MVPFAVSWFYRFLSQQMSLNAKFNYWLLSTLNTVEPLFEIYIGDISLF